MPKLKSHQIYLKCKVLNTKFTEFSFRQNLPLINFQQLINLFPLYQGSEYANEYCCEILAE